MAWRFEPAERLADAFRRVASEEIGKVRAGLSDPERDRATAIHEARQGFKRLRALLRLAKPSLGDAFREENRLWREAGLQLAGSRDHTVLMESFEKIVDGCKAGLPSDGVRRLRSYLAARRRGSAGSDGEDRVEAVLALLDDAERRLATLDWPDDEKALAKGLKRSQARLRKTWIKARKTDAEKVLHNWRKRVKDQSAQLRLFRRLVPSALRSRHSDEKKTAELLGEEHDLWMLAERLTAGPVPAQAASACKALLGEIGDRRKALRTEALKLGKAFSSQSARSFAREVTAAWEKAASRAAAKERREAAAISRAS
ncbi:MAG: CHAD domain-containing protein [Propylenella sp.]